MSEHAALTAGFDVTAPLHPRTLIEASAGTGKTYALCGLVTYLLGSSDVKVSQFLVVTFTKLATRDLQSRLRQRIVATRHELAQPTASEDDAVVAALRADPGACGRLEEALLDLDDLEVSTIHGFAQRTLTTFGAALGVDPTATLVVDDSKLLADLTADFLASLATEFPLDHATDVPRPWIPALDKVTKKIELITQIPDLETIPDLEAIDLADVIADHERLFAERRAPIDAELATASTDTARNSLRKQIESEFASLEEVRAMWIAKRVVTISREQRRSANVRNYGDLLLDLRDALLRSEGESVRRELGRRYRYVLIDEFQDTDRVQWDIFDRCFGTGADDDPSRLVLVGDPKQAIYRFRGADVHLYGHVASQLEDHTYRQHVNHRSDAALVDDLDFLLSGASFGDHADFVHVEAAPRNQSQRIKWRDETIFNPIRLLTDPEPQSKTAAHASQIDDCVAWIERLHRDAEIHKSEIQENQIQEDGAWRPVAYDDIAVLVRDQFLGRKLHAALARAGVPSVVIADDDVRIDASLSTYNSDPAPSRAVWEWQILLEALSTPTDPRRARAASIGLFGPEPTEPDIAAVLADGARTAAFQQNLARWAAALTRKGVGPLLGCLRAETAWVERSLVGDATGRLTTDLEHVGELLVAKGGAGPISTDRLLEALEITDVSENVKEALTRRLPSDAPAVKIMSLHKAKGLEFPIVGCLGLDDSREAKVARFHRPGVDAADPGAEVVDLSGSPESLERATAEETADELRLMYVGFTRPLHHLFGYWTARDKQPPLSPIERVLVCREVDGKGGPSRIDRDRFITGVASPPLVGLNAPVTDGNTDAHPDAASSASDPIQVLLDDPSGRFTAIITSEPAQAEATTNEQSVDRAGAAPSTPSDANVGDIEADGRPELRVASFERHLDRRTRRWSYSSIAQASRAGGHDDDHAATSGGDDEGPATGTGDEPVRTSTALRSTEGTLTPANPTPANLNTNGPNTNDPNTKGKANPGSTHPLSELPRGRLFGTLVHEILERVDFASPDLEVVLQRETQRALSQSAQPLSDIQQTKLTAGLARAIRAPLGTCGSVASLADITLGDRLSECRFDLRLDTRARPQGGLRRIAEILVEHLASDDPYRSWAEDLATNPTRVDIAGQLNGSLDLVFRTTLDDGSVRFHVADYKTNALESYDPAGLVDAMVDHDYPLQALLYSVTLHRYLNWRLADYDPAVHLGDARYLFLRGMTGTPDGDRDRHVPGVASWAIPLSAIRAVDAFFSEEGHS